MIEFQKKDGKTYCVPFCEPNLNFLAHAQSEEIDLGSTCGGHGVCGKDKIQFDSKAQAQLSPITSEEKHHLSPEEIKSGWRLACQCFPEGKDLPFKVVCEN